MTRRCLLGILSAIILSVSIVGCGKEKKAYIKVDEKETTKDITTTETEGETTEEIITDETEGETTEEIITDETEGETTEEVTINDAENEVTEEITQPDTEEIEQTESEMENSTEKPETSFKVGDYITFGTYEQNNVDDGTEQIEWKILDVKDGKALVISKYCLEFMEYNEENESVTWQMCSLRKWLNKKFYDTAFSEEDKLRICETTINNTDNYEYDIDGGLDTSDKIFLLSIEEAEKYIEDEEDRIAYITEYLKEHTSLPNKLAAWWLRSPGDSSRSAAYVGADGSVNVEGYDIGGFVWGYGVTYAVRPVLWIDLES